MSLAKLRQGSISGFGLLPPRAIRSFAEALPHGLLAKSSVAALTFAAVTASLSAAPGVGGFFGAVLALLMIAIAAIDARAFIIPNPLTLLAFLLGLASCASGADGAWQEVAFAALRGGLLAFGFFALREGYYRLRGRHGLGLGDVKLAAVGGVWLSWPMILAAIEIAAAAALFSVGFSYLVRRCPFDATTKLPFGLYFAPAIWLCWLIGELLPAGLGTF
ncbi:MAG TPA: prepilin peptidase [Methylocella sp.]|nr:prepilin peptidase [Methylocella sp.]